MEDYDSEIRRHLRSRSELPVSEKGGPAAGVGDFDYMTMGGDAADQLSRISPQRRTCELLEEELRQANKRIADLETRISTESKRRMQSGAYTEQNYSTRTPNKGQRSPRYLADAGGQRLTVSPSTGAGLDQIEYQRSSLQRSSGAGNSAHGTASRLSDYKKTSCAGAVEISPRKF
jgi:hypothetical protein